MNSATLSNTETDLPDVSFLPTLIQNLFSLRGQFVSIKSRKTAKVRKDVIDVIEKESIFTARVGCSYEKLANVKLMRESGIPPAPRPWGSYVEGFYPYLIIHNDNYFFHFTTVNNNPNCIPKVRWLRNGDEISADEAKTYCLASEFPKNKEEKECFDMNVDHIIEINGEPV